MCAILDANVAFEVFGDDNKRTDAGERFLKWVFAGAERLVVGGKLLEELRIPPDLALQLQGAGRMKTEPKATVDARAKQLQDSCSSDDPHIVALALVSGARLLYTNDHKLMEDFTNPKLIDQPQGKIYPARGDGKYRDGRFQRTHRDLLRRRDLCRRSRQPA